MIDGAFNIPSLYVPAALVRWENSLKSHSRCAFVLAHLLFLHKKYQEHNLYDFSDFMWLDTYNILDTMYYAMKYEQLRKCLKTLENDGLIERNGRQAIKVCIDKINLLIETYFNDNDISKDFLLYYDCYSYEQQEYPSSNVSYILSIFINILKNQSKSIVTYIDLKKNFNNIFTRSQLNNMLNILVKDNAVIIHRQNLRYISANYDVIEKIINIYHKDRIPHLIQYHGGDIDAIMKRYLSGDKDFDMSKYEYSWDF